MEWEKPTDVKLDFDYIIDELTIQLIEKQMSICGLRIKHDDLVIGNYYVRTIVWVGAGWGEGVEEI